MGKRGTKRVDNSAMANEIHFSFLTYRERGVERDCESCWDYPFFSFFFLFLSLLTCSIYITDVQIIFHGSTRDHVATNVCINRRGRRRGTYSCWNK